MDRVSQNFRAEGEFVKLLLSLPALCNEKEMEKLTKLAEKNVKFAPNIVKLIEDHLLTFKKKWRGYFNLMENIIKNTKVGDIYRPLFSNNIVSLFHRLFKSADHSNRLSMFTRRSKWTGLFPPATLYALDLKLKSVDPTLPVMPPPPRVSSQPSIARSLRSSSNARGKELKRKLRSEDDCVQQPKEKKSRKDDREKVSRKLLRPRRQKQTPVIPPLVPQLPPITLDFVIPISCIDSVLCDPRFQMKVCLERISPSVLERIRSKESTEKVKETKCERKRKRETDEIPSAKRRQVLDPGDYSLHPIVTILRLPPALIAVSQQKTTSSLPYVVPDFLLSSASDNDVLNYVDSWIDHPVFAPAHEYVTNLIATDNLSCPVLSGAIGIDDDLRSFSREIAPHFVIDESTAPSADAVLDEYLDYLISLPDNDLQSPPPSVAVAAPSPWARRIPAPAPSPREEMEIRKTRLRQRNVPQPPKEPSPERIYNAKRGVWSGRN